MKRILMLLTGVAVVLAFGLAYADNGMIGTKTFDKDSMLYTLDPSLLIVESEANEAGGSAAGGFRENPDSLIFTLDPTNAPVQGYVEMESGGAGVRPDSIINDLSPADAND